MPSQALAVEIKEARLQCLRNVDSRLVIRGGTQAQEAQQGPVTHAGTGVQGQSSEPGDAQACKVEHEI